MLRKHGYQESGGLGREKSHSFVIKTEMTAIDSVNALCTVLKSTSMSVYSVTIYALQAGA